MRMISDIMDDSNFVQAAVSDPREIDMHEIKVLHKVVDIANSTNVREELIDIFRGSQLDRFAAHLSGKRHRHVFMGQLPNEGAIIRKFDFVVQ